MSTQTKLNYLFISICILYEIFTGILKLRGIYIVELAFWIPAILNTMTSGKWLQKGFRNKAIAIWGIWVIYSFINWRVVGLCDNELYFITSKFVFPISIMFLVYVEAVKNLRRTTLFLLMVLLAFAVLGMLLQRGGSGGGTGWDARGGTDLGNTLPLNAVSMTFVTILAYIKGYIKNKHLYILMVIALAAIFFTSTRKAIGAWAIGAFFLVLTKIDYRKSSNIFKFLFIALIAYAAWQYVMHNTMMGQRFNEVEDASEAAMKNYEEVWLLKFLGDRALQYILGWELFLENPLTGIGLRNFMSITGFPVPLHSEYMVQLCESGIVGSSIYLTFKYIIIKKVFVHKKRVSNNEGLILLSGIAMILFLNLTSWSYEGVRYFIMYGLILAVCNPVDRRKFVNS